MSRWLVIALCLGLGMAWAAPLPPVVPPGDPMSLKRLRIPTIQVHEALAAQPHRLLREGPVVAAADAVVATAIPREDATIAQWHGYFLLDARAAARLGEHVELSLNAVAFQVTASSGYRALSGVSPGVTARAFGDVLRLGGAPLYAEVMGVDLGETTVGRGVLYERQLMEGGFARFQWRGWHASLLIGGQTHNEADDLFVTTAGFGRWLQLSWLVIPQDQFERTPEYLSLSGDAPGLGPDWRLSWEAALRRPGEGGERAVAGLLKLDWRPVEGWGPAQVHLGYQARFYQQGYGPDGDDQAAPLLWFSTPLREETLATNAGDYYEMSGAYHQWSHTVVVETRAPFFTPHLALDMDLEARAWFFRDVERPARARPWIRSEGALPLPAAPDPRVDLHGRVALAVQPQLDRPDRLRMGIANTFTPYDGNADGMGRPFTRVWLERRGWFVFASLEAFL
ncbi:MAG: hypothetical protein KC613_12570 [Myxococcales bacterium]|nr:hypothetical protein [Myxococcales bacterium]